MQWILIVVQAVISGAGVLLLRYASQRFSGLGTTQIQALVAGGLGALMYGVSFLLWVYILSKTPATYAFPLTIGISLAVTTVGAVALFGEQLSGLQSFGLGLLLIAVVLIGAFGKAS
jgi:multidrug transporter EmrE-like cation transporter